MTTSAMNSDKISLAQAILSIDNPEMLSKVKKQVYIILGRERNAEPQPESPLQEYTYEELMDRLSNAYDDAKNGRVYASEDVHDNLEKKYPWLCD